MRALLLLSPLLRSRLACFRSQSEQVIVELALRQQLATYARKQSRPRLTPLDRAFWVALSRLWSPWREALVIVKSDTVVRGYRRGFRVYWRTLSKRGPGRPPISDEVRRLIPRLAAENGGRARKIQTELLKLGLTVHLATVSRYLPRREPDQGQRQRWATFLRNPKDGIAGMDFFVVPTVCFRTASTQSFETLRSVVRSRVVRRCMLRSSECRASAGFITATSGEKQRSGGAG